MLQTPQPVIPRSWSLLTDLRLLVGTSLLSSWDISNEQHSEGCTKVGKIYLHCLHIFNLGAGETAKYPQFAQGPCCSLRSRESPMTNNQPLFLSGSSFEVGHRLISPQERTTVTVTAQFHCHLLSRGTLGLSLSSKGAGRSTLKQPRCEHTSSSKVLVKPSLPSAADTYKK